MRAYKAFDDSEMEELGDIAKEQIPALVDEADESLSGDRQFGIGLYRSEQDFMEVRPVGKSEFLIWSDVISASKGIVGLLSRKKHIQKVVQGRDKAIESASDYWDMARDAFEQKYS